MRWPLNTRVNGGARRYAEPAAQPGEPDDEHERRREQVRRPELRRPPAARQGHLASTRGIRCRTRKGLGGHGVDELTTNLVQDSTDPYADVHMGPSQRDRRAAQDLAERGHPHAVGHLRLADLPLPLGAAALHISTGMTSTLDGVNNDIYPTAFEFTGVDDAGNPTYKEIGACETVNCGRGAALSQFNLRVSKVFRLPHGMNIEAIARRVQPLQRDQPELRRRRSGGRRVLHRHAASHAPNLCS